MPPDDFLTKLLVAGVTILGTIVVALLSAHLGRASAARDRRRETYGEAYRTAVEWREMVYRVRRRTADSEKDLVEKFHGLQERIAFHEGWIGSESKCMRLNYLQLVRAARSETKKALREAWDKPPAASIANFVDDEPVVVDLGNDERFLKAVRRHLSWQPWRHIALWWACRGMK